ncbi:MAG: hypothetical protein R6T96_01990, partial [Longimicrobiales bacterium]
MHRRDFLKGAAAGLVLLPHTPLSGGAARPSRPTTTVALIRTSNRKDGVRRAMALLNPRGLAGKKVMLKPNFNTDDPAAAGTHNDTLSQIITELRERDAREVTVGESSFPPTREVMAHPLLEVVVVVCQVRSGLYQHRPEECCDGGQEGEDPVVPGEGRTHDDRGRARRLRVGPGRVPP